MFVADPVRRVPFLRPNFQLLVFIAAGNHFIISAYVIAPGDVAHPVVVSWHVSLIYVGGYKLIVVLLVFPDLHFSVHAAGHEPLVDQTQGLTVCLRVHVIVVLGQQDARVRSWAPAQAVDPSVVRFER